MLTDALLVLSGIFAMLSQVIIIPIDVYGNVKDAITLIDILIMVFGVYISMRLLKHILYSRGAK